MFAQSIWDASLGRSVARQAVLGPADEPGLVDLSGAVVVGEKRVGDVGALAWVAEQLDVVGTIDRACGSANKSGPSLGEMILSVAIQRACLAGPKRDLADFLSGCMPRVSCLPSSRFSGQAFHRLAASVTEEQLATVQLGLATAAVKRFELATDVLAFDTTNFDTHIATTTEADLAQRGHAKSKRSDLRVVGLALLVSETGHVPLLYRTYAGNSSDHTVLADCLDQLRDLHDELGRAEGRADADRTLVRDGGSWSEQMELSLDMAGYYTLVSLPLSHTASERALEHAAKPGSMRKLKGKLAGIRVARLMAKVGDLDRTLLVVESPELLRGQKRGIDAALAKARPSLDALVRRAAAGKLSKAYVLGRTKKLLAREHLHRFVVTEIGGDERAATFRWHVDEDLRRELEQTRLGRRVLCTDRHAWSSDRIVWAFRGQWNAEEMFRRAKGGGVVPWGPSHQWADASLRVHTFATVLGLTLVSLARLAMKSDLSASATMQALASIKATLVRPAATRRGRPPTYFIPSELTPVQRDAVLIFKLDQWFPALLSASQRRAPSSQISRAA
jgi:hypothetical protein